MDIDQNMTAQENLSGSEIGGASESAPRNPLRIFNTNLERFRRYALGKGAWYDHRGYLMYNNKILTRADTEYLAQSETPFQRLLDEEELRAAFYNLVDYAESYFTGESNE